MASQRSVDNVDKTLRELAAAQQTLSDLLEGREQRRGRRRILPYLGLVPLQILVLAVLPFWLLIRGSVYAFHSHQLGTWSSLAIGALLASLVLTIYGAWIAKKLMGKARIKLIGTRVVIPVVIAFSAYSLIYLSGTNAKSESVRQYYRSLHPILRVAVSTMILADREIVITDLQRSPEDYARMGLPVRERSLHYPDTDGYVYAMDLRTIGRSERRNWLVGTYFRLMGFWTVRHVGTADHLHVSLRPTHPANLP